GAGRDGGKGRAGRKIGDDGRERSGGGARRSERIAALGLEEKKEAAQRAAARTGADRGWSVRDNDLPRGRIGLRIEAANGERAHPRRGGRKPVQVGAASHGLKLLISQRVRLRARAVVPSSHDRAPCESPWWAASIGRVDRGH